MTVRETIQIFHRFDVDTYLSILKERGAKEHPQQEGAYLIDDLPFYKPKQVDEHMSVLSFNYAPLPSIMINALVNHPELVPDDAEILWLIEQDSFLETTMGAVRRTQSTKGE